MYPVEMHIVKSSPLDEVLLSSLTGLFEFKYICTVTERCFLGRSVCRVKTCFRVVHSIYARVSVLTVLIRMAPRDPTYAVAASMAAPLLHVTVPEGLAGQQPKMTGLQTTPNSPLSSESSSGLDSPEGSPRQRSIPPPSPGAHLLPR